jgi:two-component system response regulator NreC
MAKLRLTKESPDEDHNSLSILLADDHKIVRSGLRSLIERNPSLKIVAEADQGRMAVQLCREFLPDVVITDISMPDLNGIEATRQILEISPKTKVIILSMHSSQHFVEEVFKAGASGYFSARESQRLFEKTLSNA